MKNSGKLACLALLIGGLAASLPAKADAYFRDNDRAVLSNYVTRTPDADGKVEFYGRGATIPGDITYTEVPAAVASRLSPPPAGDEYVTVGRNVYLIDHNDRTVVAALKLDN